MKLDAQLASLVLFLAAASVTSEQTPEVKLPSLGKVRGSVTTSQWKRRTIYQFQGIPYAQPPVGELRFKPPKPALPWNGTLNATQFNRKCPMAGVDGQDSLPVNDTGNPEDCLHLNVYSPKIEVNDSQGLPVMVYFHGGSFRVGSAQDFLPEFLVDKDIVLVVTQYRLGPFGFLCLQTEDIPGNVGLIDMLLSLQWVQENIQYFGGDPTNVTIFGQSAGGAAVTLLMVSPMVKEGLFTKVIAQSGSAFGTWVMDPDPVTHARSIAKRANCTQENLSELSECLRNVPADDLLHAHSAFLSNDLKSGGRGTGGNHAVIQQVSVGESNRFLVESPITSFEEGRFLRVPMMAGVTKHEGSFILGNIYDIVLQTKDLITDTEYLSRNFTKDTLDFGGIEDPTGMVTHILTEKYFGKGELGDFTKMTPGLVDICGVALLKAATFRVAQMNSRAQPTYMYTFNFKGKHTMFGYGEEVDYPFPGGVAHSDDLIYLFPHADKNLSAIELKIAETMSELWTNFAITGSPAPAKRVPYWPPISEERGPYLRIDKRSTVLRNFLYEYMVAVKEGLDSADRFCALQFLTVFLSVFVTIWHFI